MSWQDINKVKDELSGLDEVTALQRLCQLFPEEVAFSTSFGLEDQLITHYIWANEIPVRIFTLDTGRMFPETYRVWSRTVDRYQQKPEVFFPKNDAVQELLQAKGPNSFYQSVENRKKCCFIRKVEPLNRALRGVKVWVTGIRAEQSAGRNNMENLEWDEAHGLIKFHPLFFQSLDEVKYQIAKHNVPYNSLHDRGFPSIGCEPCTRAVQPGDDFRAGRWWWEDSTKKECGLHVN